MSGSFLLQPQMYRRKKGKTSNHLKANQAVDIFVIFILNLVGKLFCKTFKEVNSKTWSLNFAGLGCNINSFCCLAYAVELIIKINKCSKHVHLILKKILEWSDSLGLQL